MPGEQVACSAALVEPCPLQPLGLQLQLPGCISQLDPLPQRPPTFGRPWLVPLLRLAGLPARLHVCVGGGGGM
jgi:hypothetical protein